MSSGSSTGDAGRGRFRVCGIPKKCWCGERVVAKISNSEHNPYRRYYRCGYAAELRLMNDGHVFKWVDEAMLDEIEMLEFKVSALDLEVKELKSGRLVMEDDEFEKMRLKMESEVLRVVDNAIGESWRSTKKVLSMVVVGCLAMVVTGVMVKGNGV